MPAPATAPSPRGMLKVVAAYAPSYALPALLGLATLPLLSRELGPEEFGIYGVCLTLHGLMLTFGADPTTNALRRLYAREDEQGQGDRFLRAIFGLSVTLACSVATLVALAVLLASALAPTGAWPYRLLVLAAMTALYTVFQYLLTSMYVREHVRATATTQVVHTTLKSATLVGGAIVFGTATGSFAAYGVALVALVGVLSPTMVRLDFPLFDRSRWALSLRYGVPLIGFAIAWLVLTGLDRVTLASVISDKASGQYAVAYLLSDFSVQAVGMLLWYAAYPSMVRQWERGDRAGARRTLRATADVFLICGATAVTVLAVSGERIVRVMAGSQYSVPSAVPLLVGLGVLFYRMAYFETIGFEFALESKRLAGTFLLAASLCVPITLAAISVAGLEGAAASTTISFAIFWVLVRVRGPEREVTAYPVQRLARVLLPAAALVALAQLLSPLLAVLAVLTFQPLLGLLVLGRWRLLMSGLRPR